MDINNKEELKKLYSFTFQISGDCPNEILNTNIDCNKDKTIKNCVLCWRKALGNKIEELENKKYSLK